MRVTVAGLVVPKEPVAQAPPGHVPLLTASVLQMTAFTLSPVSVQPTVKVCVAPTATGSGESATVPMAGGLLGALTVKVPWIEDEQLFRSQAKAKYVRVPTSASVVVYVAFAGLEPVSLPIVHVLPPVQPVPAVAFVLQMTALVKVSLASVQPTSKVTCPPATTGSGESLADVIEGVGLFTKKLPWIDGEHAPEESHAKA